MLQYLSSIKTFIIILIVLFQNDERAADVRGEVELDGAGVSLVGRPAVGLQTHPDRARQVGQAGHEDQAKHLSGRHHLCPARTEIRRSLKCLKTRMNCSYYFSLAGCHIPPICFTYISNC